MSKRQIQSQDPSTINNNNNNNSKNRQASKKKRRKNKNLRSNRRRWWRCTSSWRPCSRSSDKRSPWRKCKRPSGRESCWCRFCCRARSRIPQGLWWPSMGLRPGRWSDGTAGSTAATSPGSRGCGSSESRCQARPSGEASEGPPSCSRPWQQITERERERDENEGAFVVCVGLRRFS